MSVYDVYHSQFLFMFCKFKGGVVHVLGKSIRISLSRVQIIYVITNEKFRTLQIPPGRTGNARGKVGRLSKLCLDFVGENQKRTTIY